MRTLKESLGGLIMAIIIIPSFIYVAPTQSFLLIYTFLLAMVGAASLAYVIVEAIMKGK